VIALITFTLGQLQTPEEFLPILDNFSILWVAGGLQCNDGNGGVVIAVIDLF
jgi:hypothetical protein